MVPFADGFWQIKSLNDTVAAVGLFLTLFSIWLTWWLGQKALHKEVSAATRAARLAVERVAISLSQADISDAIRFARETIEAARNKRWERAAGRCEDVQFLVARIAQSNFLVDEDRSALEQSKDDLRLVQKALDKVSRLPVREQNTPAGQLDRVRQLIVLFGRIEGRLRAALMEIRDEPRETD